jgi:hypothetical protein
MPESQPRVARRASSAAWVAWCEGASGGRSRLLGVDLPPVVQRLAVAVEAEDPPMSTGREGHDRRCRAATTCTARCRTRRSHARGLRRQDGPLAPVVGRHVRSAFVPSHRTCVGSWARPKSATGAAVACVRAVYRSRGSGWPRLRRGGLRWVVLRTEVHARAEQLGRGLRPSVPSGSRPRRQPSRTSGSGRVAGTAARRRRPARARHRFGRRLRPNGVR